MAFLKRIRLLQNAYTECTSLLHKKRTSWAEKAMSTNKSDKDDWININVKDHIQTIRINRPKTGNAVNLEMAPAISEALEQAAKDDNIRLTLLTGTDGHFSSGAELDPRRVSNIEEFVVEGTHPFEEVAERLINHPKLLMAAVNGPAIGAAATMLSFFDVVYASDKAFFRTPFVNLGIVPEMCATYLFPLIMGPVKAKKLLVVGEKMSAKEALECGLLTEVFPAETLQKEAWSRAVKYSKLPTQAVIHTKGLIREWHMDILHRVNKEEIALLRERLKSSEFQEAFKKYFKNMKKHDNR